MVKKMAERKWMGSILLPRRQREDFSDEYDSISSKVAKEWLIDNSYEVYSFRKVITELELRTFVLKDRDSLVGFFGERLENVIAYDEALRKLSREAKVGLMRDYAYFGLGPDLIVKKDHEMFFVDVIVNQAKPKKYSSASFKIARQHGFRTMCLKLDVEIKIGETSLIEI
jgi:hypothetical protein